MTLSNTARSPADRWSGGSGPLPSAAAAAAAVAGGLESSWARSAEEGGVVAGAEKVRRGQRDGTEEGEAAKVEAGRQ